MNELQKLKASWFFADSAQWKENSVDSKYLELTSEETFFYHTWGSDQVYQELPLKRWKWDKDNNYQNPVWWYNSMKFGVKQPWTLGSATN